MVGGAKMELGSLEPEQFLPKIDGESWIMVKNNRMRYHLYCIDKYHIQP
jgi:hypothetical protein